MEIMDLSGEDGECQVEAVITPQSKKGKKGRLPFQTLSTDSPKVNKKRKSVASPDCRSAKHPKVNTKENSFKKSDKGKTEEIVVITEEKEDKNDSTTVKDTSKLEEKSDTDSPKNKKTPGRGPGKHKKAESKVPVNPLTKFFKKIDSKDSKNEAQSPSSKNNEGKTEKNVETESKKVCENAEDGRENEDVTETKKDEEHHSDSEEDVVELHETSSSSKENETVNTSHLNETDNMDVDSDPNSDSDDSHDNDDDSHKSDTDCKKTEHEDTDSKDDVSRGGSTRHIIPAKNKLLDSKGKERKLTPKQLEKKLESQKKREMRDKQRQEREKKLQEERESRKREEKAKQLGQKKRSYDVASNMTDNLVKFGQRIFQLVGKKRSMMPNPMASTSNLTSNESKSDGCREIVDDILMIKFDVNGNWELLSRALQFGSSTFTPLVILFNTNLSARVALFSKYFTQDGRDYKVFYANQVHKNSSELLLLANKHVNLNVKYHSNNLNLPCANYFIAVKVKLDESIKFNVFAIDICTLNAAMNRQIHDYIQSNNNFSTIIFINCHQDQTPNSILQTSDQFELKKRISYRGSRNSTVHSFFYMSKMKPVGMDKINIVAPALESPTCIIIKKDNESE